MRKIHLFMNGNQIAATWDNFDCFATSPAGFGDTIGCALTNLIANTSAIEINGVVSSIENAPQNTKELAATDSQHTQPKICPRCEGHGTLGTYLYRDPPEAKVCPQCRGTGKLPAGA